MYIDLSSDEYYIYKWADGQTNLNIVHDAIQIGIKAIKQNHESQELSLSKSLEQLKEAIKNDPKLSEENEYSEQYFDFFYSFPLELEEEMRAYQRQSTVLMAFSYLERNIKMIVRRLYAKHGGRPRHFYKSIIERNCELISTNFNTLFTPELDEIKQKLIDQIPLRNAIAHTDSIICEEKMKRLQVFSQLKFIPKGTEYIVRIEDESYITILLKDMSTFFNLLLIAVDKSQTTSNS